MDYFASRKIRNIVLHPNLVEFGESNEHIVAQFIKFIQENRMLLCLDFMVKCIYYV